MFGHGRRWHSAWTHGPDWARRAMVLCAVVAGVILLASQSPAGTLGIRLWVARYDGPGDGIDIAHSLGASPDGTRVFVTGESYGGSGTSIDYATVAYDAVIGARLWTARYNGPGNQVDVAYSLGVSPDGTRVFVTGDSQGRSGIPDYATVAYDAVTGARQWVARYNGPGDGIDTARSLRTSPDGTRVFVTGESYGASGSSDDYATVAYDAVTGAQLWVARYNGPGNGNDVARSLRTSPDGTRVFVTGESPGSGTSYDYATVAYDAATGAQLWAARYNGPGNDSDQASSLGVSPDGTRVFVTGHSYHGRRTSIDYATVAYNSATGAQLWAARYNGPGNGIDGASSLGVSPDGTRVFVTGESQGPSDISDYATVAYDTTTGARLWERRYDGPANLYDKAYSLGVSPDGARVFVTGASFGTGMDDDYATIAYDAATGTRLWEKRYDGPGDKSDRALSLEVGPDGTKVFVTGASTGSGTSDDYATIAYGPSP